MRATDPKHHYFNMYEPAGGPLPQLAFLWPALAAASVGEIAEAIAKQFVDLAVGPENGPALNEPNWATPNTVALELKVVRLRDFATTCEGRPILVCAPFALHAATIVDLAPGHSLVARLEALRVFAQAVVRERGFVGDATVEAFMAAGFTKANVLEVVTIAATKTISNYTNHITHTEKESFMADAALEWTAPRNRKAAA